MQVFIPLKWETLYYGQQWYETMVHTFLGGDQADYEDYKKKKKLLLYLKSLANSVE